MKCPNVSIITVWQQENIHYSQMHTEHSGKTTREVTQHILTNGDYTECIFWPYSMKLEINQRRKPGKLTNMCKFKNINFDLKNKGSNSKLKGNQEMLWNKNESITWLNLWDAAKGFLRGNFILINTLRNKKKKSHFTLLYLRKQVAIQHNTISCSQNN